MTDLKRILFAPDSPPPLKIEEKPFKVESPNELVQTKPSSKFVSPVTFNPALFKPTNLTNSNLSSSGRKSVFCASPQKSFTPVKLPPSPFVTRSSSSPKLVSTRSRSHSNSRTTPKRLWAGSITDSMNIPGDLNTKLSRK
ncbi:hypothetical protein PCE1_002312 [Barthelona sp. PCE]